VSGEIATGAQQATFNAMDLFMGVMTDPFVPGRREDAPAGVPLGYAATGRSVPSIPTSATAESLASRWNVWTAAYGGTRRTDGNSVLGSNDAMTGVGGMAVGADYRAAPNTLAGFAIGGAGTSFGVANGGSGRADMFQAGSFVRQEAGTAYFKGALAYGWQDATTDRTLQIEGVDHLRGRFKADALSARIEAGSRIRTAFAAITPYAAAQSTIAWLPGYAEQFLSGASTFSLAYGSKAAADSTLELGIRTDRTFALPSATLTLRGRLSWAHDLSPDRAAMTSFQTLPGTGFVVNGASAARDSALTTSAAEIHWLNGFSLAGTFEGNFSGVTQSYAGKAIARYE